MSQIEKGLGELLTFISDVAIAIRMNSSYNGESLHNPKTPETVMQLSDSIHNLHQIGNALSNGDYEAFSHGIEMQLAYWEQWKHLINDAAKVNVHTPIFDIENGIDILKRIKQEVN